MNQDIKCEAIFIWDDKGENVEEIRLVNIDNSLMIDINKHYDFKCIEKEIVLDSIS